MRLLQALNINPVNDETMFFSCKIPTRILGEKEVIGLSAAAVLLNDVYLGVMNKRGCLEVCW
jgi:hypothetical protein